MTGCWTIVHEAISAMDLRRVASVVHRGVTCDEFGDTKNSIYSSKSVGQSSLLKARSSIHCRSYPRESVEFKSRVTLDWNCLLTVGWLHQSFEHWRQARY
jgi:hypothetical protein